MAYIGNTATTQAFTPAVDYFNGDGSTVAFTLSKPVASVAQVQAVIENVPQNPGSAYTVSGNTITFTSAPPSGTANIYVYYTSPITQVIAPSQGTVGSSQLQSNLALTGSLTVDGTTLVVDDTNNRVGIGTSSPSSLLDIEGASATQYINATSGNANTFYQLAGTTTGSFEVGGGNSVYITANNASGNIYLRAGGATTRATIAGSGYLRLAGGGIQFNGDTADANSLDDYEEGTFTPTAFGGSSSGTTTYTMQQGSYIKIGRCVTVSIRLEYSAMTGTGNLTIGGLPFASPSDSMEYMGSMMVKDLNWGGGSMISFYMPQNSTTAYFFYFGDDSSWSNQQCVNESVGLRMTLTYFTV